jgi:hypothetical protein
VIDEREIVRRAVEALDPPEPAFERLRHRRDRKRRNQRITAGIVGIAVFVAAVWVVTSGGVFDRSETSVVPGGDVTGPGDLWRRDSLGAGSDEVVAHYDAFPQFIYVYADGRVIMHGDAPQGEWKERRLTPEGLDLVRSGAVGPTVFLNPKVEGADLPQGAWADHQSRRYMPSRFAVCFRIVDRGPDQGPASGDGGPTNPSRVLRFFPSSAQAILRGEVTEGEFLGWLTLACSVVTPEERHALHRIIGEPGRHVMVTDSEGNKISWWIIPLLPHGEAVPCTECF